MKINKQRHLNIKKIEIQLKGLNYYKKRNNKIETPEPY